MTFVIGTPHARGAGYVMNDDTASGGKKMQGDVQTCAHCQTVIIMQQWKENGAWCSRCGHPICVNCGVRMDTHGCENFLRHLEQSIGGEEKLSHFRKLAGIDPPEPPQALLIPARIERK